MANLVVSLGLLVIFLGAAYVVLQSRHVAGATVAFALFGAFFFAATPYRILLAVSTIAVVGVLAVGAFRTTLAWRVPLATLIISLWYLQVAVMTLVSGQFDGLPKIVLGILLALLLGSFSQHLDSVNRLIVYRAVVLLACLQVGMGLIELIYLKGPIWGIREFDASGHGIMLYNPLLPGYIPRIEGTTGQPIILSTLLAVAAILVISGAARLGRWPSIAALAIFATGLVLSGTRSAIVALVAGIVYLIIQTRDPVKRLIGIGSSCILLVAFLALPFTQSAIQELVNSGSFTHRLGAIEATGRLLARPPFESLFGLGSRAQSEYYERGLLQHSGLEAVDNQFVSALTFSGVVGLVVLLVALLRGYLQAGTTERTLLLMMVGMFLSFDVLLWTSATLLLLLPLALDTWAYAGVASHEAVLGSVRSATHRDRKSRRNHRPIRRRLNRQREPSLRLSRLTEKRISR
jgi:hypothetical protein